MADDTMTVDAEQIDQDIRSYEHAHNRKKALAISLGMKKRKDKQAAAHYLIQTLKKSMAAAPPRVFELQTENEK